MFAAVLGVVEFREHLARQTIGVTRLPKFDHGQYGQVTIVAGLVASAAVFLLYDAPSR